MRSNHCGGKAAPKAIMVQGSSQGHHGARWWFCASPVQESAPGLHCKLQLPTGATCSGLFRRGISAVCHARFILSQYMTGSCSSSYEHLRDLPWRAVSVHCQHRQASHLQQLSDS